MFFFRKFSPVFISPYISFNLWLKTRRGECLISPHISFGPNRGAKTLALFSALRCFSPVALVFLLKNHIPYFKCVLIIVSFRKCTGTLRGRQVYQFLKLQILVSAASFVCLYSCSIVLFCLAPDYRLK